MKLELLEIPSPCNVPWDTMRGDNRVRHCLQCHLDVFDLSAMTRAEAERFLEEREGKTCVTLLKRHDGTVVTQDCSPQRFAPAHACAPSAPGAMSMAAAPPAPGAPGPHPAAPTTPHPPPPMRMGGAPPPMPMPAKWETVDPRVGRGTLLADLVRALRSALPPEDLDRRVREVERALELPASWQTAHCPRETKCPLWIPAGAEPVPAEFLTPRTELLAVLEPITNAAFDAERAGVLLREVRRTALVGMRGNCPHCRAWIGLPPPKP